MGLFDAYQQRRRQHTTPESVATLSHMEEYFQGGEKWTQGVYHGANGTKCLVGAAEHVRVSSLDDAKHWLRQAIAEHTAGTITTIEGYNDSRQSFGEIEAVINRAKQLAAAARLPAPATLRALPAPEILPPVDVDSMPVARDPVRGWRRKLSEWSD